MLVRAEAQILDLYRAIRHKYLDTFYDKLPSILMQERDVNDVDIFVTFMNDLPR